MEFKTLETWEKEAGVLARDREKYPSNKSLTQKEFNEILKNNLNDFQGCNHNDRIAFLKANRYEITHENMLNADLSARTQEQG